MWQAWHPMFVNTCCPRVTEAAELLGVEAELLDVEGAADPDAAGRTLLAFAAASWTGVEDAACPVVVVPIDDTAGVAPDVAGVGGAKRRMNIAKLTTSEEKSDAALALFVVLVKLVASSGVGLIAHPAVVFRSFGNSSLVTPISTL